MSEHQGIQDQDPAERLAAALRRIAVGIERREAAAAATRAALDGVNRAASGSATLQRPAAVEGSGPPVVVANIDSLIARLRAVLDELPPTPPGIADPEVPRGGGS